MGSYFLNAFKVLARIPFQLFASEVYSVDFHYISSHFTVLKYEESSYNLKYLESENKYYREN